MDFREAMLSEIAIGIGCRSGVSAESVVALTSEILRDAPPFARAKIFTLSRKAEEPGLRAAASSLGFDLMFLDEVEFLARQSEFVFRGATPSEKTQELTGFASVAEAAALLGAGPSARLIVSRRAANGVTAAIAACEERK
jgi:cobalamin biosynthesis protein CbiG